MIETNPNQWNDVPAHLHDRDGKENAEPHHSHDAQWQAFSEEYETVHREFLHRLRHRFPELPPTEVKICVLTYMNLPTKKIASILSVDHLLIQKRRVVIRKKLGISGREGLHRFLLELRDLDAGSERL